MCIYPEIASKVRAEIDSQIGRDRIPTLNDQAVLPYTDAVLKEVIRFYPVFPLGEDAQIFYLFSCIEFLF